MCVLSTPEAPASNGTPPPRPDPAPQSSYLGSMAPARGWLEGGMREGAQQCKNARTAHLAGSRYASLLAISSSLVLRVATTLV